MIMRRRSAGGIPWSDFARFYTLRLHENGGIKSSPHKLIADATDWRFLNELKRN